ncbi:Methionyl/Valyl/Leucyl/Isoleucyl-tRNA synthetase [Theobroma cacao]|nr:Methionyl/Valyl/Leucyl/Isoleucyl-tRNA synthetase [Theobroma cacao]WRX35039.1 Methionyl/Valyl/Leucyl/Isoleucyl-tRNA synthetase [Theobroma cacao]
MAYYTISHLLQKGEIYGTDTSIIKPKQLIDKVWDFVFCDGPYPKSSDISSSLLSKMKEEFEYWYPFDIRTSSKDLLQSHVTFCIYNHTAVLHKHHRPRGFKCIVHNMLNSEAMSKSKGNFKTIHLSEKAPFQPMPIVCLSEINLAVKLTEKNYNNSLFREALKTGFYDLQSARDEYRFSCGSSECMNFYLLLQFMDVQTRLMTPICPHYAEYVWRVILMKDGYVVKAGWPKVDTPDLTLKVANKYLQDTIASMRNIEHKRSVGLIYVNAQYDGWKAECLNILRTKANHETSSFAPDEEILDALQQSPVGGVHLQQTQSRYTPFLKFNKDEAIALGLPFSEIEVLQENSELIKRQLDLEQVEVLSITDPEAMSKAGHLNLLLNQNLPNPGNPTAIFFSV